MNALTKKEEAFNGIFTMNNHPFMPHCFETCKVVNNMTMVRRKSEQDNRKERLGYIVYGGPFCHQGEVISKN